MSSFCSAKATHIFSAKNIRILYIESAKTVNEMTLNELVKLTTLLTTRPQGIIVYPLVAASLSISLSTLCFPIMFVLKLGGQLDHEVVQCILFRGYSIPNFDRVIMIFKDFSDLTLFADNSFYSYHPIRLKHCEMLGYEMMQSIVLRLQYTKFW